MLINQFNRAKEGLCRSLRDLLPWLVLVPFILGLLYFIGSLALVWPRYDSSTDTRSQLLANYRAWLYDSIPSINIEALVGDIIAEQKRAGVVEPTVVQGVFLVPPSPTAGTVTVTPQLNAARTATLAPTATATSASVQTHIPLTATALTTPTRTATSTRAPVYPTLTSTSQPRDPATATPRPPTATPTASPTATKIPPTATPRPLPPSATPVPPTAVNTATLPPPVVFTPTPAIVHPIAENDGNSVPESGGCLASFGYLNDNPQPVDIPAGSQNYLSPAIDPAPQATHFLVGRMYDVFQVVWNTPGDLVWSLDGQAATVRWCNP